MLIDFVMRYPTNQRFHAATEHFIIHKDSLRFIVVTTHIVKHGLKVPHGDQNAA